MQWDPEITRSIAVKYGFESDNTGPRTGLYNFADIDDDFISLHHWMKWYKFGFSRTFDNLSLEIRNKRLSRTNAIKKIESIGYEEPTNDIDRFCEFSKISRDKFDAIAENFRNNRIWKINQKGIWYMPDFLTKNWRWDI